MLQVMVNDKGQDFLSLYCSPKDPVVICDPTNYDETLTRTIKKLLHSVDTILVFEHKAQHYYWLKKNEGKDQDVMSVTQDSYIDSCLQIYIYYVIDID
jgi:hypothetical protein